MSEQLLSQDNIVTTWLEAEAASPRFRQLLTEHTTPREAQRIIREGTPKERFALLAQARPGVTLFPWEAVRWAPHNVSNRQELGAMRTCAGIHWLAFSNGTRLVSDAADWISQQPAHLDPHLHVHNVQAMIADHLPLPPIIAYLPSKQTPAPIVWEGHVRAMAYYLSGHKTTYPLQIYLGQPTNSALVAFDSGLNLAEARQMFLKEEV